MTVDEPERDKGGLPAEASVSYRTGKAFVAAPAMPSRYWLGRVDGSAADSCGFCGSPEWWTSRSGLVICRRCHPPAPGAEEKT